VWVLLVLPLAVAWGVWRHQVAWWLIAIPLLRVLNLMALGPRPWLALTRTELQGRDGDLVWTIPTRQVASILLTSGDAQRIEFADARGRLLAHAPPGYTDRQIEQLARALGVRTVSS
jgi:hypothetical protein